MHMKNVRAVTFSKTQRQAKLVALFVVFGTLLLSGYGIYGLVRSQNVQPKVAQASVEVANGVVAAARSTTVGPYVVDARRATWITGPDGKTYLSIETTIQNTSQDIQQLSPLLQTRVVDTNGVSHAFTADADASLLGGPLNPGGSTSGTLNFQLVANNTFPTLYFRATPDSPEQPIILE